MKHLKAVVFDWAGTTVDYGCQAPAIVFMDLFREIGISVLASEVRRFMGLPKQEHTRHLFELVSIRQQFMERHGRMPVENDVVNFCNRLEIAMELVAPGFSGVIEGIPRLSSRLNAAGVAIGSGTGYSRKMIRGVVPLATAGGFTPETIVVKEEITPGELIKENLRLLQVNAAVEQVAAISNTINGIRENRQTGCWSIAWSMCGNELGLSSGEVAVMPVNQLETRLQSVNERLLNAGADYVVHGPWNAWEVFQEIEQRIKTGDKPGNRPGIVWDRLSA